MTDNPNEQSPDLASLGVDVHVPLDDGGTGTNAEATPQVEKTAEPQGDAALRAEIAKLKQDRISSEKRLVAERDAAIQQAQQYARQAGQSQHNEQNSYMVSINNAIEARNQVLIALEAEYRIARETGDFKKEFEISRRVGRLEAELGQLEEGKRTAEVQMQAQKQQQQRQSQQQPIQYADPVEAFLARSGIRGKSADWVRAHPSVINDPQALGAADTLAQKAGHAIESDGYFEHVAQMLGIDGGVRQASQAPADPEPLVPRRAPAASAPPTHQAVQTNGQRADGGIALNRDQRRAAEIAGASDEEYAAGLVMAKRLGLMK